GQRSERLGNLHGILHPTLQFPQRLRQRRELARGMLSDLRKSRRRCDTLSTAHDGYDEWFASLAVIGQRQDVSAQALIGAVTPPALFSSGPRDLALRKLAPWLAGIFLELIGAIERGRVDRGVKVDADTESIDWRFRRRHHLQHVLIDTAAHQDDDVLK